MVLFSSAVSDVLEASSSIVGLFVASITVSGTRLVSAADCAGEGERDAAGGGGDEESGPGMSSRSLSSSSGVPRLEDVGWAPQEGEHCCDWRRTAGIGLVHAICELAGIATTMLSSMSSASWVSGGVGYPSC